MQHVEMNLLKENVAKVVVGKSKVIDLMIVALLSEGHVLLEDMPGLGKTVMAKALAKSVSADFARIQFTPDLLPADVTGLSIYNQKTGEFQLRKGPVFCHLLLADEINRATPRTQSSLLEAMAEKQVTLEGETHILKEPFMVIATQNPIESQGTFPLPEAQLDRFLMKIPMGYPSAAEELELLTRVMGEHPIKNLEAVTSVETILRARAEVKSIKVNEAVSAYMVALVGATREHPHIIAGASPRATIDLMKASQALAYLSGRSFVIPEDVQYLAPYVLAHRLVIDYAYVLRGEGKGSLLEAIIENVPVPLENR